MHKRAFEDLKLTFMHVSGLLLSYFLFKDLKRTIMHVSSLTSPYFDKKSATFKIGCFYPKMARENLRHPSTCVSGPETHVSACCRSSPTLF